MWVTSDYVVNKGNMNKENPFAQSENRKVQNRSYCKHQINRNHLKRPVRKSQLVSRPVSEYWLMHPFIVLSK